MKPFSISPRLSRNFPPEARYLVGVSGGRDSVVLLHWLVNLGYDKLIVCHLDHQLRGRVSVSGAKRSTFMCANIGSNFARTHRTRILIRSATAFGIASSRTWRKLSAETFVPPFGGLRRSPAKKNIGSKSSFRIRPMPSSRSRGFGRCQSRFNGVQF